MRSKLSFRSTLRVVAFASVSAFALGSLGCASSSSTDIWSLRNNPTPELRSLARSSTEMANKGSIYFDTTHRSMVDDILSLVLADRPSRMQRPPTPW